MFMLVLHILCHNLVGYESSRGLGTKIAECGYETSKPGYESSGYEKSMGTKRLVTTFTLALHNFLKKQLQKSRIDTAYCRSKESFKF